MELDKIRNLGPHELKHEEQQASEQLFRLRFQMRLGQTEGVKKLRGLKKDVARIKTITRERELGLNAALHGQPETEGAAKAKKKTAAKAKKKTAAKRARKSTGKKAAAKKVAKTSAKKKVATKTARKTKKKEAR
jgi:large subunit ribosomal protein L29